MLLSGFRPNFRELWASSSHSSSFKTMTGPRGVWQHLCSMSLSHVQYLTNTSEPFMKQEGVVCLFVALGAAKWPIVGLSHPRVTWVTFCCVDIESPSLLVSVSVIAVVLSSCIFWRSLNVDEKEQTHLSFMLSFDEAVHKFSCCKCTSLLSLKYWKALF